MKSNTTKNLVKGALIGAFYAVLTLALGAYSFGNLGIELRVSEALTILPLFTPAAVPGLFIGCLCANLIGMAFSGLGAVDVIFGSLATLLAASLTYAFRNMKIKGFPAFSFLPPIMVNAVVVGAELSILMPEQFSFLYAFAIVGVGEAVVVTVLGVPLYLILKKNNFFQN